ncbi:unnamed protein product [Orchesella dallaii]|uniref:Odorant receptor n=1 Tax=Orchesella dallaii TaxID=48710 RepID=A0ABP1RJR8_9HEXA
MANKLTISALKLHTKISSYHSPPYIIYWNIKSTTSDGKYCVHPRNSLTLLPWYLSNIIVFGGIFVAWGNFVTLFLTHNNNQIPIISIFFSFSVGMLGLFAFGVNIVFFYSADEYTESLNRLIRYGNQIAKTIPKTNRRNASDKVVGMFALWGVLLGSTLPFVLVPFQWVAGYDPTLWVFNFVLGNNFEEILPPVFRIMVYAIRLVLSIAYLVEISRTLCMMCLIMILEPPLFFLCLQKFEREPLDYPVLQNYCELCRIRNISINPCGQSTGISMASTFLMMTLAHVAYLFYWDRLSTPLIGCLVGATICMDSMVHMVLPWVTKLYDMSSNLIYKWRKQNAGMERIGWKRKHLGMLLKGMRPIAFKVGNVGTLKEETKLCYFQSILDAFCDLAMTLDGINLL